jgi:hypothetical protein
VQLRPIPALAWSTQHVGKWLRFLGLPQYVGVFEKERVNGSNLMNMTDDVLEEMSVSDDDAAHILSAIHALDLNQQHALSIHKTSDLDDDIQPIVRERKNSTEKTQPLTKRPESVVAKSNIITTQKEVVTYQSEIKANLPSQLPDFIQLPIYTLDAIACLVYKTMEIGRNVTASDLSLSTLGF